MAQRWSRRSFFGLTSGFSALGISLLATKVWGQLPASPPSAAGDVFPALDPALVREAVGVSHRDLKRAQELVERQPALARASIDWGFGDWEACIDAASHVGNKPIADFLLANGARPTIFSAAMMGQLDVVKAFIAARPGVQKTPGPHGLTLMWHAKQGGPDAAAVVQYLTGVGDALVPEPLGQQQGAEQCDERQPGERTEQLQPVERGPAEQDGQADQGAEQHHPACPGRHEPPIGKNS